MLHEELPHFFERDLLKLKEEIRLYKKEGDLWIVKGEVSNSGGNLCLHLIGNLYHFVGAAIGKTGYIRTRDLEFSSKNVPRERIIKDLDEVIAVVKNVLGNLSADDYKKDFPLLKHNKVVTTEHMLLHLLTHLSYHLGQVNYHRRLIS